MTTYIVKPGESIWDVCLNATGTLANLDLINEANNFQDWTPDLMPGQGIIIPDTVTMDNNAQRQLALFPVCNFSRSGIAAKIETIFDILANNWILQTGLWNGNAIWTSAGLWNSGE